MGDCGFAQTQLEQLASGNDAVLTAHELPDRRVSVTSARHSDQK
jgi:hypothetical protein